MIVFEKYERFEAIMASNGLKITSSNLDGSVCIVYNLLVVAALKSVQFSISWQNFLFITVLKVYVVVFVYTI